MLAPLTARSAAPPAHFDAQFYADAVRGLGRPRKELPCKYFYDAHGSALFERICELPEYYPTRCELEALQGHGEEIAEAIGPGCMLIEYGSGSSTKTRLLLDRLSQPAAYVPVDISGEHLAQSARALARHYRGLEVLPVGADFTRPFALPRPRREPLRRVVYFSGSTIGNFTPPEAQALLAGIARLVGPGGGLLIGVDLKKDRRVLHAAYNDAQGVTAAFNRNLLTRINRELGGTFDVDHFHHDAFYNAGYGRIEMHLVSGAEQSARVGNHAFRFRRGETIRTEYSHKFTVEEFRELARPAGLEFERVWTDRAAYFSVQLFRASTV
jgi:dimethylhistidine N-methyltransferase